MFDFDRPTTITYTGGKVESEGVGSLLSVFNLLILLTNRSKFESETALEGL